MPPVPPTTSATPGRSVKSSCMASPWFARVYPRIRTRYSFPMIESDAITWTAPDSDHPARRASQRSAATVARGVKDDWVALFAADGVVEDPVGPSVFDAEGKGHHGHEGIAAFWDVAIAGVRKFHFTNGAAARQSFRTMASSSGVWITGANP